MPLFLYVCQSCNNQFEILSFKKDEKHCCDKCGSDKLEKLFGKSSFVVNGFNAANGYSDTAGGLVRTPIIGDRNTGKNIGLGKPEILKKN